MVSGFRAEGSFKVRIIAPNLVVPFPQIICLTDFEKSLELKHRMLAHCQKHALQIVELKATG